MHWPWFWKVKGQGQLVIKCAAACGRRSIRLFRFSSYLESFETEFVWSRSADRRLSCFMPFTGVVGRSMLYAPKLSAARLLFVIVIVAFWTRPLIRFPSSQNNGRIWIKDSAKIRPYVTGHDLLIVSVAYVSHHTRILTHAVHIFSPNDRDYLITTVAAVTDIRFRCGFQQEDFLGICSAAKARLIQNAFKSSSKRLLPMQTNVFLDSTPHFAFLENRGRRARIWHQI